GQSPGCSSAECRAVDLREVHGDRLALRAVPLPCRTRHRAAYARPRAVGLAAAIAAIVVTDHPQSHLRRRLCVWPSPCEPQGQVRERRQAIQSLGTDGPMESVAERPRAGVHHLGAVPTEPRAAPAKPDRTRYARHATARLCPTARTGGLRQLWPASARLLSSQELRSVWLRLAHRRSTRADVLRHGRRAARCLGGTASASRPRTSRLGAEYPGSGRRPV